MAPSSLNFYGPWSISPSTIGNIKVIVGADGKTIAEIIGRSRPNGDKVKLAEMICQAPLMLQYLTEIGGWGAYGIEHRGGRPYELPIENMIKIQKLLKKIGQPGFAHDQ